MRRENVINAITKGLESLSNKQLEDLHNAIYEDTQVRYCEDDWFEITGEVEIAMELVQYENRRFYR